GATSTGRRRGGGDDRAAAAVGGLVARRRDATASGNLDGSVGAVCALVCLCMRRPDAHSRTLTIPVGLGRSAVLLRDAGLRRARVPPTSAGIPAVPGSGARSTDALVPIRFPRAAGDHVSLILRALPAP